MRPGGIDVHLARQVLAAQPFSALLGTEVDRFGPDGVSLRLEVTDELRQQHGYVHGGVISYLVDNAIAFAAGAVLGADVVSAGFSIEFVRPATGGELRADAVAVHVGSSGAVVRCEVLDAEARTVAVGQGRAASRSHSTREPSAARGARDELTAPAPSAGPLAAPRDCLGRGLREGLH